MCKCASVQTVIGQQSSASTSTGCVADPVIGRAIPCFPHPRPRRGDARAHHQRKLARLLDQRSENVCGSVKGSEAGNADSVAHERRSPAPAFSTRLSLALGLPTSPWVVGARKGRLWCWCWTADRWKFAHLHICTLREVAACTASDHAALCALAQMRKPWAECSSRVKATPGEAISCRQSSTWPYRFRRIR